MRSDADSIRRKTEELNNKIQEFKDLLSSQANDAKPAEETNDIEPNGNVICKSEEALNNANITQPSEGNEVLSLKSLASNVIENNQNKN